MYAILPKIAVFEYACAGYSDPDRHGVRESMINDAINISHFRQMLVRNSRVQIPDFLQPDAAETLRQCLLTELPWALAARSGGQ